MSACLRHCRRLCAARHENILRPKTFSSGFKTSPADAELLTPRRAGKAILARQSGCGEDIWSAPCDALADVVSRTVAPFFSQMLCLERLGNFSTSLSRQPICRRPIAATGRDLSGIRDTARPASTGTPRRSVRIFDTNIRKSAWKAGKDATKCALNLVEFNF